MIEQTNEVVLTDEQFESVDRMLRGISRKYRNWYGISEDDIYQECWVKTLKLMEKFDGELPNLNLIASSCYNRIFDMCKYHQRRQNQLPSWNADIAKEQASSGRIHKTDAQPIGDYMKPAKLGTVEQSDAELALEEIMNLFDVDSRERRYIYLIGLHEGVFKEERPFESAELFGDGSRTEFRIAKDLGYANDTSNGYRGLKRRVQSKITEFNEFK